MNEADTAGGAVAGEESPVIRMESVLVRWEDGLALFRVRLTRGDGAAAEAHGAAHDGEAEHFWTLAEERARTAAAELLATLPIVRTVAAPPSTRMIPPATIATAQTPSRLSPGVREATTTTSTRTPPGAEPHRAPEPPARPVVTPARDTPRRRETAGPGTASTGPSQPSTPTSNSAANTPAPAAESPPEDVDPFMPEEDTEPFADDTMPSAEPPVRPHIRGESGGPPGDRTHAAPVASHCAQPGCGRILTPGQVTLSTRKAGAPLCPQHLREKLSEGGR